MVMFNDQKFEILGMKTMKYILLVICVACASTTMAVDYKLHQTSSANFKSTSTSGYCIGKETMSIRVSRLSSNGMISAPIASFQSTSAMPRLGSSLPQAAFSGATTTCESANPTISGPRRIGGGNSGGGDGPENPDDVWATPIGNTLRPLLLWAAGYIIYIARRKSTPETTKH